VFKTEHLHPKLLHKYWAFISYSHADEAFAKRLQTDLETHRIPEALIRQPARDERVPTGLFQVFSDRGELPGAPDIGAKIREGLIRSRSLVAVYSPIAVRSHVDHEIRLFAALKSV